MTAAVRVCLPSFPPRTPAGTPPAQRATPLRSGDECRGVRGTIAEPWRATGYFSFLPRTHFPERQPQGAAAALGCASHDRSRTRASVRPQRAPPSRTRLPAPPTSSLSPTSHAQGTPASRTPQSLHPACGHLRHPPRECTLVPMRGSGTGEGRRGVRAALVVTGPGGSDALGVAEDDAEGAKNLLAVLGDAALKGVSAVPSNNTAAQRGERRGGHAALGRDMKG
ncbi:hypothetical protein DFH09DRAFT_1328351 [Mycena vulgaris]|nr:hypothetical protein DFH09DRAFT_1328351 [Mycena vulgaris]